jgi:hypothetical protein
LAIAMGGTACLPRSDLCTSLLNSARSARPNTVACVRWRAARRYASRCEVRTSAAASSLVTRGTARMVPTSRLVARVTELVAEVQVGRFAIADTGRSQRRFPGPAGFVLTIPREIYKGLIRRAAPFEAPGWIELLSRRAPMITSRGPPAARGRHPTTSRSFPASHFGRPSSVSIPAASNSVLLLARKLRKYMIGRSWLS